MNKCAPDSHEPGRSLFKSKNINATTDISYRKDSINNLTHKEKWE